MYGEQQSFSICSHSPPPTVTEGGGGDGDTELILTVSRDFLLTICQDSNPSGPVIDLMKCIRTYGFDLPQKFANTKKKTLRCH